MYNARERPEATSQTRAGKLSSFPVPFPVRGLLSAGNKQTLALSSHNILKMDTEAGKHTAPIRDHLGQRSSSAPQPLAPRDVHPVTLAASSGGGIPGRFLQTIQPQGGHDVSNCPWGLGPECRVCWSGAPRARSVWAQPRCCMAGCPAVWGRATRRCVWSTIKSHISSAALCRERTVLRERDSGQSTMASLLAGQFSPSQLTCHFPLNTRGGGGPR